MDLLKLLSDLRAELSQLEGAIIVFERLATGQRKGSPAELAVSS